MLWRPTKIIPSPGFIAPCIPTEAKLPPRGEKWVSEIKHDGYRLMVRRTDDRVRIYTRRGADWTKRFPWIVEAVKALRVRSVVIDGEGVVCDRDGVSDFNRLHSKTADHDAFLYAFDLLELDGADLRAEPLEARKGKLAKLLKRAASGIRYNEHVAEEGAIVFRHACELGLEGIVCKRIDLPYRSGKSRGWIKLKNPRSAAMMRVEEGTF